MKHKINKVLSILLALALVLGLAPAMSVPAQAAESNEGKAIVLGTGGIVGPEEKTTNEGKYYTPKSYVWFGVNGDGSKPIQWRVLDAEKANDGTTAGMFLLSEYLLADGVQFEAAWDYDDDDGQTKPNDWQNSDGQVWCSAFASNLSNFTPTEQAAMLGVDKTDAKTEAEERLYSLSWEESELKKEKDKIFFLSVRELAKYVGNYDKAPGLTASFDDGGSAGMWWLRSPNAYYTTYAGAVDYVGRVGDYDVNGVWAARPAFNLNLNSVLFTSAAENGKDGSLGALSAVGDYTGSEWKLTVSDSDRSGFAASFDSKTGDVWTIKYSGAKADSANEYISALIKNSAGEVTYYGRLCEAESGDNKTVTVDLAGKLSDGDTLYVFNEQYNGDKQTDYASEMKKITESSAPPVSAEKAIQLVENGVAANIEGAQASSVYFGSYKQSKTGDAYNEDPIKWRVLENSLSMLFLLADQNLDVFRYHNDNESVTWEKSTMRSWLNGYSASENWGGDNGTDYSNDSFIGDAFAAEEQAAIAETVVENPDNGSTPGGNDTTDKVFLLSIAEARNSGYGFTDDNSRISTNTAYVQVGGKIHFDEGINNTMYGVGEADVWWLRSPGYRDHFAADVTSDGFVNSFGNFVFNSHVAVRPAFNLNLNSVLFTSAAENGKDGSLGALSAVGDYSGSEWKLTVSDSDRSGFAASFDSKTGDVWTIKYSGAKTGANEFISALIKNSAGEVTYYGRLCEAESGDNKTVTVDLAGKLSDGDTLYVFNEQYNGDKKTDYASALKEITPASVTEYKITVNGGKAYSDFGKTIEITAAAAGTRIYIKYDTPPAGKYVQSISCSAGEFDVGDYIYYGYEMPAAAVTFEVITADMQERIIDLTSGSATVDWDVWFQNAYGTMSLIQMDGYSIYDLDNDGKNDIRAAWTDSRNPVTVTKLDTNSISSSWAYKDDTANMPYKITLKFDGGVELLTEDGAPFTVGKMLRPEGMSRTAGGTGEPAGFGYDPDNISMTLRVSGAGSAAEALTALNGATFERAARSAGGNIVFERLTLAKGASSPEEERILSYTKQNGEIVPVMHIRAYDDGGIYIELTSLAPGAVRLTLEGREYLLATPGDVNLDGEMDANDWANVMRWALEAPSSFDTKPDDDGYTVTLNKNESNESKDYNLWILMADIDAKNISNSADKAQWRDIVDSNDWRTIMYLTLEAWKK